MTISRLATASNFAVSVDVMVQVYPLPAVVAGPSAPYAVITGGSSGIGREIANEVCSTPRKQTFELVGVVTLQSIVNTWPTG